MEEAGGGVSRIPHGDTLEVFYWSIESRVNAASFSARITETRRTRPASTADNGFGPSSPWTKEKGEQMTDLLNLAMLVCASVGSMAFGILAAYGILRVGFALMRPQPLPVTVKARVEAA